MLNTVKVPKEFEPVFVKAQEYVNRFFKEKKEDPSKGTIEIFGERYILVRAASMSIDFFETVMSLYKGAGEAEAVDVALNMLFDISHAIGKADARRFHETIPEYHGYFNINVLARLCWNQGPAAADT